MVTTATQARQAIVNGIALHCAVYGTSQPTILPATTHDDIFASPALAAVAIPILEAPLSPRSQA